MIKKANSTANKKKKVFLLILQIIEDYNLFNIGQGNWSHPYPFTPLPRKGIKGIKGIRGIRSIRGQRTHSPRFKIEDFNPR